MFHDQIRLDFQAIFSVKNRNSQTMDQLENTFWYISQHSENLRKPQRRQDEDDRLDSYVLPFNLFFTAALFGLTQVFLGRW